VLSDDFPGTSLNSANWTDGGSGTAYDGESGGTATGYFISQHVILKGDSIARFQAYPDPTNIVDCYQYNPTLGASLAYWGGAGTHSKILVGPGSIQSVCMKFNTYPGIAPMAINYGTDTEFDFAEINQITTKNQAITKMSATIHWSDHGPQFGIEMTAPTGVDFSQWHVWQVQFLSTGLIISCDGAQVGSFVFSAAQLAGGILDSQNLCLQIQTGDVMPNPGPDASVTATTPIELDVDWVIIDIPVGS
jgi:hypothetical protein